MPVSVRSHMGAFALRRDRCTLFVAAYGDLTRPVCTPTNAFVTRRTPVYPNKQLERRCLLKLTGAAAATAAFGIAPVANVCMELH